MDSGAVVVFAVVVLDEVEAAELELALLEELLDEAGGDEESDDVCFFGSFLGSVKLCKQTDRYRHVK